eukprot:TRINITY_DN4508_c0_g1_i1.p1 TRINITY_DN4508_c0_g1~~TRINITY_DN4508_c0_g1_i1.p1  ORF type:complete len:1686 (+),score=394.09 TRINITY_DN4508_c0_g1_i1:300-5357(+)
MAHTNHLDPASPPSKAPRPAVRKRSSTMMDEMRKRKIAYEYLCHLEEIKQWIEACIKEELPVSIELEEALRNGVFLAKLAHFMTPDLVPLTRIYDLYQERYIERGLEFRHTDNINFWVNSMKKFGLPKIFYPTTTDLYDRKNMPRVIYCLHALSLYLNKLGKGPVMEDLVDKAEFTEEEISVMTKELDKYNIKMPAFAKINGILTEHLTQDEAAVHAAIMAVNEAIDKEDPNETLSTLKNPAIQITHWLRDELCQNYQGNLYDKKNGKKQRCGLDRGVDPTTLDAYDYNLTREEIQDTIENTNTTSDRFEKEQKEREVAKSVNDCVKHSRDVTLLETLLDCGLFSSVSADNMVWYMDVLARSRQEKYEQEGTENLTFAEIEKLVAIANNIAEQSRDHDAAITTVNQSTADGDHEALLQALQWELFEFNELIPEYIEHYMRGLQDALAAKPEGELLSEEEVFAILAEMNEVAGNDERREQAVLRINQAIGVQAESQVLVNLLDPDAELTGIIPANADLYAAALESMQGEKGGQKLVLSDIQSCIDLMNAEVERELRIQSLVTSVSNDIATQDEGNLQKLLNGGSESQFIADVDTREGVGPLYLRVLTAQAKANPGVPLNLEQIQECVRRANEQQKVARSHGQAICSVNTSLRNEQKPANLIILLLNPNCYLSSVIQECAANYQTHLVQNYKDKRASADLDGECLSLKSKQSHPFWFNTNTEHIDWTKPSPPHDTPSHYLNRDEIQEVVAHVTADHSRWALFQANEPLIINIQSMVRGYFVRKRVAAQWKYFKDNEDRIICVQAFIKGYLQRKYLKERQTLFEGNIETILFLQRCTRGWLARHRLSLARRHFMDNIELVVRIQAWWRGVKAKENYQTLVADKNPPIASLNKFLKLLDQSDADIAEELEVNSLRGDLTTKMRLLKQHEIDLTNLDIKIGLLIRNQITLKDVIHVKSKVQRRREQVQAKISRSGIKNFTASSRKILDGYQHLFYLLQTNPNYIARVLYLLAVTKKTEFLDNVVLALYNYGTNPREMYLFMKMIQVALLSEIGVKVTKIIDISTMNSVAVKILIKFTRESRGGAHNNFKELLRPLVKEIIFSHSKFYLTPVDIYKQMVNLLESQTGTAAQLPYDVDSAKAMEHPEVQQKMNENLESIKPIVSNFISVITENVSKIPYGLRYITMLMRESLLKQFPNINEDELVKVLSNLIYYRYINPIIVNPESYGLIDMDPSKGASQLTVEQRKNLSSISRVMQNISNRKIVHEDSPLYGFNQFILEKYEIFKAYIFKLSSVESPEEKFGFDEYTDLIMISKPVVRLSAKDIISTHKLFVEHATTIAENPADTIHEILADLGTDIHIRNLVGEVPELTASSNEDMREMLQEAGETEIALTLSSKHDQFDINEPSDAKAIFVQTKGMCVDLLRIQPGETLADVLDTPPSEAIRQEFADMIQKQIEKGHGDHLLIRTYTTALHTSNPTIDSVKNKIKKNLDILEEEGLVTKESSYQEIINAIAKDITNQARHRKQRRVEKKRLNKTLTQLHEKENFHEEQYTFYQQYINSALDNMAKAKNLRGAGASGGSKAVNTDFKPKTIKYTAQKLYDKGVILEIEGIQRFQYRSINIEIKQIDASKFEVHAKFLGNLVEKTDLVIQDLLQLQFDGVAVCKIGSQVKVNVNLLIFLINKKLYGKQVKK